jgi:hypothetical protein
MLADRIHRVAFALEDIDKPVIAAMRGAAVGAGLDMALLCDMRIAGESAMLSEGYIKVGLVPGDGGAWLLPRIVGSAKAMELLMTGDFVDAQEALRLGMVNRVVPDPDVLNVTYDLARRIAAAPPVQISMIRRLVRQSERIDLRTHYDLVSSHFGLVVSLDDYAEAIGAFRERRTGRYQGRLPRDRLPQIVRAGERRSRQFFGPGVFGAPFVAPGPQPTGSQVQGVLLGHPDGAVDLVSGCGYQSCGLGRAHLAGGDRVPGGRPVEACRARRDRGVSCGLGRGDLAGQRGQVLLDGLE